MHTLLFISSTQAPNSGLGREAAKVLLNLQIPTSINASCAFLPVLGSFVGPSQPAIIRYYLFHLLAPYNRFIVAKFDYSILLSVGVCCYRTT